MTGRVQYRVYEKGKVSYRTITAADCRIEDGHYVFYDLRRQELCRLPLDEYGALIVVSGLDEK